MISTKSVNRETCIVKTELFTETIVSFGKVIEVPC
jgi:hypothetical protein